MSPPWMPFYPADYLGDTRRLTTAQHGAYLLLIMEYWVSEGLPDDDAQLSRIVGMSSAEWRKTRPIVQSFFQNGWKHERIDFELAKAKAKHERRQQAGKSGGIAKAMSKQNLSNASSNALASSSQPQPSSSLRSEGRTRACALAEPWSEADRERFWAEFPNKVGKADAMKAFDKASHKTTPEILFPALHRYATKTDDRPFCNPSTWLNQERWLDQPVVNNGTRNLNPARRSASADFFAGIAGVAADIAGDDQPSGVAAEKIPLGRFNIDG